MAGKLSLGYVLSLAVADNVYMGGAMVTDPYGLPLEFRYTEPVRATKLQKVLYGDVLEKYIHCDVITGNLVSRLEQKPDLFLAADATLLPAFESVSKKAVWLGQTRVPPLKEYGALQEGEEEFFLQLSDSGSPVRVRFVAANAAQAVAQRAEAVKALTDAGRTMDLFEPLARIETAIKMLWEEVPEAPLGA